MYEENLDSRFRGNDSVRGYDCLSAYHKKDDV